MHAPHRVSHERQQRLRVGTVAMHRRETVRSL
jgi:hypothetical protein